EPSAARIGKMGADECSSANRGVDESTSPRFVQGARHRGQIDAKSLGNRALRRQSRTGLYPASAEIGLDRFDNAAIFELAAFDEPRTPGGHKSMPSLR